MLDFPHLRTREQRRAAVLRDMLDVTIDEYVTGPGGERVDYRVPLADEIRLVLHLRASEGRWCEA